MDDLESITTRPQTTAKKENLLLCISIVLACCELLGTMWVGKNYGQGWALVYAAVTLPVFVVLFAIAHRYGMLLSQIELPEIRVNGVKYTQVVYEEAEETNA